MSNDLYPNTIRGLRWTLVRTPEFSTIVQTSPSFHETTIIQATNPRWHWELKYNYLKDNVADLVAGLSYTDFATLRAFFLKHYGQGDNFLFNDLVTPDYSVGPALITAAPNLDAQLQVMYNTADGYYYSPLQVKRGGTYYEDIDYVNGAISVYENGTSSIYAGSPLGPGLAIPGFSFAGMYLKWSAAHTPVAPVTAQFSYYWRVRFSSDQQEFEKFMHMLWAAGDRGGASIKFRSARAYAAE
jgi:hypothetical protein